MCYHSWFSSVESALGYECGMVITGYVQQRDGLKGGREVISSNHNKGRALGPSRLGGSEKELLCGKSSRCHCTCRPKQCHWSPQFAFYLFMSDTEIWIYGAVHVGGPNLAMDACLRYYPIRKRSQIKFMIFQYSPHHYPTLREMKRKYKGFCLEPYRKWNLKTAILVHSVLALK